MKKFLTLALFGLLLGGTVGCSQIKQSENEEPIEVIRPVLSIRKLASGLDSNNHSYVKFNYTISPSNASDRSIITTLTWTEEGADIEFPMQYYINCSVDESDSSITVTCLQAFMFQANLNVRSASNRDCYVDIPIDYESRLTGFSFSELEKTSSYQLNGQTVQPWWSTTADSITVSDSEIALDCEYWDYGNIPSTNKMFNFDFGGYIARAAIYSYGSVDNVHESLSMSVSFSTPTITAYGSVSTQWPNKVIQLFSSDILPNSWDDKYMTVASFDAYATQWAANTLTAAEASDLHNNLFLLSFDADVTFSGSNGASTTRSFAFSYKIAGTFFDVPVRSLSTETDSHTF